MVVPPRAAEVTVRRPIADERSSDAGREVPWLANCWTHRMKLPLQDYLEALHSRVAPMREGTVATYIPELAKVDPAGFGICIATVDGHCYAVGDADRQFTLQSISKPFVYGAALADRGAQTVLSKVGVEPSGDAFNSISLDPTSGAPLNPMINAGAIATTALVGGADVEEQWTRILQLIGNFVGRPMSIDEAVYRSESDTGFRNRAIAWMLRNFDITEGDPMSPLENYFRQCAIQVSCRDLALMAATLANGGVHPITRERALPTAHVPKVLAVMATSGMYDYAGSWLYDVGMPAKSGVSGGILAVLPGRWGIGVYSPLLDAKGNSVRGIEVCRQLSRDFHLHVFGGSHRPEIVVNRIASGSEAPSRRARAAAAAAWVRARAGCIQTLSLQGVVALDGADYVARQIAAMQAHSRFFVLDLHRVSHLLGSAARLLHETRERLADQGCHLVFARVPPAIGAALDHAGAGPRAGYLSFEDNDLAMEWCEDQLLAEEGAPAHDLGVESPTGFALLGGLREPDLRRVVELIETVTFARGEQLFAAGAEGDDRIFLVQSGRLSVLLPTANGHHRRLSTLGPGTSFGEMVLLGHRARSASVVADTDVACWVLSARRFDALVATAPHIRMQVLDNIARDLSVRLRDLNVLIASLAA